MDPVVRQTIARWKARRRWVDEDEMASCFIPWWALDEVAFMFIIWADMSFSYLHPTFMTDMGQPSPDSPQYCINDTALPHL